MASDTKGKEFLSGGILNSIIAEVAILTGAGVGASGENSPAAPQGNVNNITMDDLAQREIEDLLRKMKEYREYRSETKYPATPKEIEKLVAQLGDDNYEIRLNAQNRLRDIGDRAKAELEKVLEITKDNEVGHQGRLLLAELKQNRAENLSIIIERLGKYEATAKSTVPDLISLSAEEEDVDLRKSIVTTLGQIGPEAKDAVPQLIDALKDRDPNLRAAAAEALGKMGPEAKTAVPELAFALKDRVAGVTLKAVEALKNIGPDAISALPALRTLKDIKSMGYDYDFNRAQSLASEAIEKIHPSSKTSIKISFPPEQKPSDPPVDMSPLPVKNAKRGR